MSSSLAAQLLQGASLNSAQLLERGAKRKATESYLFSGRDANQHDLESLHALASSAFSQLKALNPGLSVYEDGLLSDRSGLTDRTLLGAQDRDELDKQLRGLLPRLGRHLMEVPTGRVLEWLVRRFRVHEFNVQDVLALFLPYHDSPHFTKMASILHVQSTPTWSFLSAHGQANAPLRRGTLVDQMRRSTDVARFVAGLLPKALAGGYAHRTVVAFHTGVLLEYIEGSKTMDSNTTAIVLPSIVDSIKAVGAASKDTLSAGLAKDVVLSSYLLLSSFSSKSHLTPQAISALLTSLASGASKVTSQQFVAALLSVLVPQDIQPSLPQTVLKKLVDLEDAPTVLVQILGYANSEKLLLPLSTHLVSAQTDERCNAILKAILSAPDVPQTIVVHIAGLLLRAAVDSGETVALLKDIRVRHGDALDVAAKEIEDQDEDVQAVLLSLAQNNGDTDATLASMDTQDTVRAAAITDIYKRLDKSDAEQLPALHTALLSRLTDSSPEVLRALYASPSKLAPIVLSDLSAYTSTLSELLPSAEPEALKLHLDFVLSHVGPKCDEKASQEIFGRILFSLLLFTRDRRTADNAWDAISSAFESSPSGSGSGLLAHALLSGCIEVLEEVKAPLFARGKKKKSKPLEKGEVASMGAVDLAIASRMADNLMLLNDPEPHLSFVLTTLTSSNPHARALASLILRAYIGRLSGPSQISTAQRTVDALGPGLSLAALDEFADVNAMLSDDGLGGLVSSKPKSPVTQAWLSASLLATCAATLRPSGALSFISSSDEDSTPYARLARTVYASLNTSQAPATLSAHVLRTLFARLSSDALALLAGTWLSSIDAKLQHTALAHAYAYLVAHAETEEGKGVVDFQTILPSLLVALTSGDKSVRQAAAHCVAALENVCKASSANAVYAFDSIYGAKSEELQYVDWADMRKLVTSLCAERTKFAEDGDALRQWIAETLREKESKSAKKKLDYKQKVLVYLLSHAAACPASSARLSLLRLTQPVRSALKARTLRPLLEELADGKGDGKIAALAVGRIDASCIGDLEEDAEMWGVLVKLLEVFARDDAAPEPRDVLLNNLQTFAPALSAERRFELARVLLKIGSTETELALLRPIFDTLFTDGRLVIRLLATLQPPAPDTVPRAAKRAKVDSTLTAELSPEMAELSTFADVLGNAPLPGSPELLSALLETLGRVVKSDMSALGLGRSEAVYIQQRLMSALERSASSVAVNVTVPSSALRVDVLVDIIRGGDSGQTVNQALLLLAGLARLAPESVLVNVMPVFTFMGSNVLGRDDSYSFRVIQKTVDSIVPVMVEDLKAKFRGKLDLAIGARDFVRVFTDAANHIPRHRRTQFFMHLTDVLGPSFFLGLLSMLFISKTANKVVRQTSDDLLATLSLPMALVHHYEPEVQREVVRDVLEEAGRLVQAAAAGEGEGERRVVLDTTHDDEQNSQSAALLRRRAQALLIFVGTVIERSPSIYTSDVSSTSAVNELLSSLLDLAQSAGQAEDLKDIRTAAQTAIGQCLRVVPATSFISAVSTILDARVQLEALTLLTERIGLVADEARKAAKGDVVKIVGHLKEMLKKREKDIVPSALGALRAVSQSAVPGEENALVETVPLIIACAGEGEYVGEAVAALVPLCSALGPRIIPHFRDVVRECIKLLRSEELPDTVHADALSVLRALFSTIPSFWSGSQLTALFALYLDVSELDGLRAFVRQIATKAQPSVLFPALFDLWNQLSESDTRSAEQCAAYFELSKRVFRAAQRPAVLEHLRAAFGVVLAGLELRGEKSDDGEDVDGVEDVEEAVVGAFVELVTKLNETAFRPLFRRLFDWAFGDTGSSDRKVAFLHAYSALLDNFKALMTPYLSIVLEPLLAVLDAFVGESEEDEDDGSLWAAALDVLAKSMSVDEGAFWHADKLAKTLPRVVAQTPVAAELGEDGEAALAIAMSALCGALTDDAQVKKLNLSLLMHTRDEEARVKLCALRVASGLWAEHGDQLMGFTGETATFVEECAEDENDEVVRAARKLKEVVERATGEKMDV